MFHVSWRAITSDIILFDSSSMQFSSANILNKMQPQIELTLSVPPAHSDSCSGTHTDLCQRINVRLMLRTSINQEEKTLPSQSHQKNSAMGSSSRTGGAGSKNSAMGSSSRRGGAGSFFPRRKRKWNGCHAHRRSVFFLSLRTCMFFSSSKTFL